MKISDGGTTHRLKDKIETITVNFTGGRIFELWINGDSLSYVSLEEMLDLRDEINKVLRKLLNIQKA